MKRLVVVLSLVLASHAADIKDLVEANRKFTGTLYSKAPTTDVDILLSPLSLEVVLALTQSGAKGVTAEEIRNNLFFPNSSLATEQMMKNALSLIQSKIANKVYVQNDFPTNEDFEKIANDAYNFAFEETEFINNQAAANAINKWAGEQTNNIFGSYFAWYGDFSKTTKDSLINALFMNETWTNSFDSVRTQTERFTYGTASNQYYNVQMMTQGPNLYNYYESSDLDAKYLEMPLGEDASLTIVLPNAVTGITKIEEKIDLALTLPEYSREFIQVSLPKTSIQITWIQLQNSLKQLGVQNMWTNEADLSGISGVPSQISAYKLIQDSYINFDEKGIQGAAGALLDVAVSTNKVFNVNRPFLFYVRVNGVILFVGKVVNPTFTVHH